MQRHRLFVYIEGTGWRRAGTGVTGCNKMHIKGVYTENFLKRRLLLRPTYESTNGKSSRATTHSEQHGRYIDQGIIDHLYIGTIPNDLELGIE